MKETCFSDLLGNFGMKMFSAMSELILKFYIKVEEVGTYSVLVLGS